jgi:ferredoxin-NADP reductase
VEAFERGAQPTVRIDGPYGKVVINPRRYRSLVFVCGGIGVTPMISMLRWYYLINTAPEVAARQSVHLAEYIYFVWVVDCATTYDVFKKTILQCGARAPQPRLRPDHPRHARAARRGAVRPAAAERLRWAARDPQHPG